MENHGRGLDDVPVYITTDVATINIVPSPNVIRPTEPSSEVAFASASGGDVVDIVVDAKPVVGGDPTDDVIS